MDPVTAVLARTWPVTLRTPRLVLRPVAPGDAPVMGELLTDPQVRAFLGGPACAERVEARQREYPAKPGAWAVAPAAGGAAIGLVTLAADYRREGRAEVSYQLLPAAWGSGLGREAVAAALAWWARTVPDGTPVIAVTQRANHRSRRLLAALGLQLADTFVEFGEPQCLYTT